MRNCFESPTRRRLSGGLEALLVSTITRSLLLVVLTSLVVWAEPGAVARVESISGDGNLFYKQQDDWFRAYVEMDNYKGQHLKTDANSMATLTFNLGGQANINKGTEIEISGDRDIEVVGNTIVVKSGTLWAKVNKQKEELKIKTSGGVMGIRGTEFVVQVLDNGETKFSLLEGVVDVYPVVGEPHTAQPGQAILFGRQRRLEYRLRGTERLLQDLEGELGRNFFELRRELRQARRSLRQANTEIRRARLEARRGGREARAGLREARAALREAGLAREARRADPDLSSLEDMGAEEVDPLSVSVDSSGGRVFSFEDLEGENFAVLVSRGDSFARSVSWATRTTSRSVSYPRDARPLTRGTYRWRVMPLDEEGRPLGTSYESSFTVK